MLPVVRHIQIRAQSVVITLGFTIVSKGDHLLVGFAGFTRVNSRDEMRQYSLIKVPLYHIADC